MPATFSVEQHTLGKCGLEQCKTLIQAPAPLSGDRQGTPTAGLLAKVMMVKFDEHLSLYPQEKIFARTGLTIPRSTGPQ